MHRNNSLTHNFLIRHNLINNLIEYRQLMSSEEEDPFDYKGQGLDDGEDTALAT